MKREQNTIKIEKTPEQIKKIVLEYSNWKNKITGQAHFRHVVGHLLQRLTSLADLISMGDTMLEEKPIQDCVDETIYILFLYRTEISKNHQFRQQELEKETPDESTHGSSEKTIEYIKKVLPVSLN